MEREIIGFKISSVNKSLESTNQSNFERFIDTTLVETITQISNLQGNEDLKNLLSQKKYRILGFTERPSSHSISEGKRVYEICKPGDPCKTIFMIEKTKTDTKYVVGKEFEKEFPDTIYTSVTRLEKILIT